MAHNRMHAVVTALTIISTNFMPLTLLACCYGMNFDVMPELHWKWAYPVLWVIFIAIAVGLILVFWRWGWLRREMDEEMEK